MEKATGHMPQTRSERGLPPSPYGWFVVALSEEIARGQIKNCHYFSREFVAFRTQKGVMHAFDPYCPHFGAHFGHGGEVVGETLRCPFHGWRFDGDGACVEVPGCTKIPPKAKTRSWPVREHNGLVFVWYHPDNSEPSFELEPLPEKNWTENKCIRWVVKTHPQEVCENTVDIAHLAPVHHARDPRVIKAPQLDGAVMRISLQFWASGAIIGMPEQENDVVLSVTMHGLGDLLVEADVLTAGVQARYRIHCTPIDQELTEIYALTNVHDTGDEAFTQELAGLFFDAYASDFTLDFPIWENKIYRPRPALSAADGPLGTYRKWSRQFYPYLDEGTLQGAKQRRRLPRESHRSASSATSPNESKGLMSFMKGVVPVDRLVGWVRGRGRPQVETDPPAEGRRPLEVPPPSTLSTQIPKVELIGHPLVTSVADYFDTLHERFAPSASKGVDAVFEWEITGDEGGTWHAIVKEQKMELRTGEHDKPTLRLVVRAEDYVPLVNGKLNSAKLFTSGKAKVKGNIRMAMKMKGIFPAPGA